MKKTLPIGIDVNKIVNVEQLPLFSLPKGLEDFYKRLLPLISDGHWFDKNEIASSPMGYKLFMKWGYAEMYTDSPFSPIMSLLIADFFLHKIEDKLLLLAEWQSLKFRIKGGDLQFRIAE